MTEILSFDFASFDVEVQTLLGRDQSYFIVHEALGWAVIGG